MEEEAYPYHDVKQSWHPMKYCFRKHHHPLQKRLQIGSTNKLPSFADVRQASTSKTSMHHITPTLGCMLLCRYDDCCISGDWANSWCATCVPVAVKYCA